MIVWCWLGIGAESPPGLEDRLSDWERDGGDTLGAKKIEPNTLDIVVLIPVMSRVWEA